MKSSAVFEKEVSPEIDLVGMADGAVAYQLSRLKSIVAVIHNDVLKRLNGRRHQAGLDWRELVDAAFKDLVGSPCVNRWAVSLDGAR
ncbi:MAG: hypothetical protein H0W53_19115 [Acidobacteria bacterium]|nr:hypothetical protein [Acidobacteriota bacterium]